MANQLKAQQLLLVWIKRDDPLDVLAALDLLRAGQPLTAIESGTVDVDPVANFTLMDVPNPVFDGIYWNIFMWVTSA